MKKVWMMLLVALMITFTCEGVYAQAKPLPQFSAKMRTAPDGWFDTTVVTEQSFQFVDAVIYNYGTDTIYAAKDKDTTYPNYAVIGPGSMQSIYTQCKWLRVKGKSAGQSYRIVTGLGQNGLQTRINTNTAPVYVTMTSDSTLWSLVDSVRFQRPATNATAYSDSDIVRNSTSVGGALIAITAARTSGGGGYITAIQLAADTANIANAYFDIIPITDTTGMGATLPGDNTLYATKFNFTKAFLPVIPVVFSTRYGSNATGSDGAFGFSTGNAVQFKCIAGSTKLYFLIIARGAYTPKNGGIFRLTAWIQPTN
jgi:hypothetical protein